MSATVGRSTWRRRFAGVITKVARNGATTNLVTGAADAVVSDRFNITYTAPGGTASNPTTLLSRTRRRRTAARSPTSRTSWRIADLTMQCLRVPPPRRGVCGTDAGRLVEIRPWTSLHRAHRLTPLRACERPGRWLVRRRGWRQRHPQGLAEGSHRDRLRRPTPEGRDYGRRSRGARDAGLTIGQVYAFEPVPTDVEVKLGYLIISHACRACVDGRQPRCPSAPCASTRSTASGRAWVAASSVRPTWRPRRQSGEESTWRRPGRRRRSRRG